MKIKYEIVKAENGDLVYRWIEQENCCEKIKSECFNYIIFLEKIAKKNSKPCAYIDLGEFKDLEVAYCPCCGAKIEFELISKDIILNTEDFCSKMNLCFLPTIDKKIVKKIMNIYLKILKLPYYENNFNCTFLKSELEKLVETLKISYSEVTIIHSSTCDKIQSEIAIYEIKREYELYKLALEIIEEVIRLVKK